MMSKNLLPYDGELYYLNDFLSNQEANYYYESFLDTIDWQNDELIIFGKSIVTKRKVAWYAQENKSYKYSGKTKIAKLFNNELIGLRDRISSIDHSSFNSCLLNLYHNGSEGMSWHSDDEKEIVQNSCIASVSLGASRFIDFKHKNSKQKIRLELAPGSLLLMKSDIQQHWLHAVPISKRVKDARINLTFRLLK